MLADEVLNHSPRFRADVLQAPVGGALLLRALLLRPLPSPFPRTRPDRLLALLHLRKRILRCRTRIYGVDGNVFEVLNFFRKLFEAHSKLAEIGAAIGNELKQLFFVFVGEKSVGNPFQNASRLFRIKARDVIHFHALREPVGFDDDDEIFVPVLDFHENDSPSRAVFARGIEHGYGILNRFHQSLEDGFVERVVGLSAFPRKHRSAHLNRKLRKARLLKGDARVPELIDVPERKFSVYLLLKFIVELRRDFVQQGKRIPYVRILPSIRSRVLRRALDLLRLESDEFADAVLKIENDAVVS